MPQQPTVLVVEDELGPRESLRAVLQADYQVLLATEGEQALQIIEHAPVDVVLLDLRLPGLSGWQVVNKLKALHPSLQVIVVTSYDPDERVNQELRPHLFAYIVKPFNVSHLRETVKRAVAHRSP
jgi:DNA-binding NtrC family response regulator